MRRRHNMIPLDKNLKNIANKVRNGELAGENPYWKVNIKWRDETNEKDLALNIIASHIETGYVHLKGFASFVNVEEWVLVRGENAKNLIKIQNFLKNKHDIKELDNANADILKVYIDKYVKFNTEK